MKGQHSGFLTMAVGLIIVFLAVAIAEYSYFETAYAPTSDVNSTANNDIPGWKTYTDNQFGFSFQFLPDFTLTEEPGQSVTLNAPTAQYFPSGLTHEAGLTINDPLSGPCPLSDGDKFAATTTTIIESSAGTFQKISFSDVGAGNLYETSEYKLEENGECYEFVLLLHSTNGAGFYYSDPDKIAAIDASAKKEKEAFEALVDRMVSTFTINK